MCAASARLTGGCTVVAGNEPATGGATSPLGQETALTARTTTLLTAVVFAVACLATARPSAAQNLLSNSQFNGSTAGWTEVAPEGAVQVGYDTRDGNASQQSGSIAIANVAIAPQGLGVVQCFAAKQGESYVWGGDLSVRSYETAPGYAFVAVAFYEGPGCTGDSILGTATPWVHADETRGSWARVTSNPLGTVAPAGTKSAIVSIRSYKTVVGSILTLNADRLFVARTGSPRCNGEVPTIVGTDGPDVLAGTPGTDVIHGLAGRDRISGGGFDTLCGGPGRDTIDGGPGNDILLGGPGPDDLLGGGGVDLLSGGAGEDVCAGGPGADLGFADCDALLSVP